VTLPGGAAGDRFDAALARALPQYSRSRLRAWIDAGRVTLDGERAPATRRVRGGERVVVVSEPDPREAAFAPEAIELTIVHEDDALIVVDKPAGLVVHPGSGNWAGTLANALVHHAPQLAAVPRAGIVHRLDKDTSGLLVVAKTLPAQTALVRQMQARSVTREYIALAEGDIASRGVVDAPIGRHPTRRTTMAVVATGKAARTHFDVVERFGVATLLRCRLETGRTHQIRVHLATLGHALVGDPTYGRKGGIAFVRQALHAARLALVHPVTGDTCRWGSPLPADFDALLAALRARHRR
jgi:23S rRNA pseudouridine1911/1915/1917 synthase